MEFDPNRSPQKLVKHPLRGKICGLCEAPLEWAVEGCCSSMYPDKHECFWVKTIREFGGQRALQISKERQNERY